MRLRGLFGPQLAQVNRVELIGGPDLLQYHLERAVLRIVHWLDPYARVVSPQKALCFSVVASRNTSLSLATDSFP